MRLSIHGTSGVSNYDSLSLSREARRIAKEQSGKLVGWFVSVHEASNRVSLKVNVRDDKGFIQQYGMDVLSIRAASLI